MTETITIVALIAGILILSLSFYKYAKSDLKEIDAWHSGAVLLTGLALLGFGLFSEITVQLSDEQSVTLKKEIERLEESLTDVQTAATEAAAESARASEDVEALKSSVETSVASVEQITDSITQSVAASLDVPQLQRVNDRLEEVAQTKAEIDELSTTVADQNAQIAALSAQLASTNQKLEALLGRPIPTPSPERLREGVLGIVYFGHGSTALSRASKATLDQVARALADQAPDKILVAGHSDSSGNPEINLALAEQRAGEVAQYLVTRGVPADKIAVDALGDADPAVPTAAGARETFNRRVVISVE